MAEGHSGYAIADDIRLRILLAIFELSLSGIPPSYAELRAHTALSNGSLSHHIPRMVGAKMLERHSGARGVVIAAAGVELLLEAGLIAVVAEEPVFGITAAGYEFLELAPNPPNTEIGSSI